jgi:RNA polymerase sigma-70 factor (ECF subfamily)
MKNHEGEGSRHDRWTAWLVRARDGDAAAFELLVREARPAIQRRALQRLQDPAQADDVAAQTFINAWKHLAGYDPRRANAGTWLFGIARNLIIDALKGRKSQQDREVVGFEPPGPDGAETVRPEPEDDIEMPVAEGADQRRVEALVDEALWRLAPADREVLRLCHFEQLSYEEIARRLGVTVKAVGPRLTRARQRLAEVLSPELLG